MQAGGNAARLCSLAGTRHHTSLKPVTRTYVNLFAAKEKGKSGEPAVPWGFAKPFLVALLLGGGLPVPRHHHHPSALGSRSRKTRHIAPPLRLGIVNSPALYNKPCPPLFFSPFFFF